MSKPNTSLLSKKISKRVVKPNREEYVVHGAKAECSRGSVSSTLVFQDRGYDVGYGTVGLDTDTKLTNFSGTFGKCKITGEACDFPLVERWIEVAKYQNVNDGHPLLMKSMVVCTNGAYISIIENGQDMGLSDIEKAQRMVDEYVKMYGKYPSAFDLNPLFWTDLRMNGKGHLLTKDQLEKTNNLFSLATQYPDYYKLDEKYGLGTPEYNAKLEELRQLLKDDFKVMETKQSVDENGETFTYRIPTWPDREGWDAILNGVVEQAIYEIYRDETKADGVSNDNWYKFTEAINGVVSDISIHKDESGSYCGNISQTLHWERNAFNRAPATWDELIEEVLKTGDSEWKAQAIEGSGYHMSIPPDGIYIIKIHRDSGQEAVYSLKEGQGGVLRPANSTYNYGSQTNPLNSVNKGVHKVYDMSTHNKWLESEDAYKKAQISGIWPDESGAVNIAIDATFDHDFALKWGNAKNQLEYAKKGMIQDGTTHKAGLYYPSGEQMEIPNYKPYEKK